MSTLRVTVWNEFLHERKDAEVKAVYPEGIHAVIADAIRQGIPGAQVRTATQDEPENGLTEQVLGETDVLTWWGHMGHAGVSDAVAERVQRRVLEGMGAIFLHSAHYCKPFLKLMGTGCGLKWRDSGERERLFVVSPGHEIADGLPPVIEIEREEMYGEFFDVPAPDEVVMISWFAGGNVFRSCCTWMRGKGRVVYFRPGHELFPTFFQSEVRRVICNAVRWAAPKSSQPFSLGAPYEPRTVAG